jgi:uncharacterized protein YqgC (DUF456 family)
VVEPLGWVALGLLVAGVAGSVLPVLPGALLSLAGVYLYWWSTGYADPDLPVLVTLTAVGVLVFLTDYFAGAVSARAVGTPWTTSAIAGVVGVVLLFVIGPVGLLAGVAGVVFLAEYRRSGRSRESARAALYATLGVLASAVVQVLLTLSMLVAMVAVIAL